MSRLQTLILVAAFILSDVSGTKDTCDPVCEHADTFVSDPYDCSSYYYCISPGTPSGTYNCPDDKIFDSTAKPDHDEPKEPCKSDTTPPCRAICETPTCHIACKNTFDVIVDPMDCHLFYVCVSDGNGNFNTHKDECPSDRPNFNGADCTSHDECCDVCNPSCEGKEFNERIPDAEDCNKYYICDGDGGMSPEQECYMSHFDVETGECIKPEECVPLCPSTNSTSPSYDYEEYEYVN
ncbi:unnamed protein product [Meganyctiphanes norvegica]|uniref:Chitin-binding type-2 domain-containing protein n=1 Tax=Meganyctiphanes norvegica TaxID=48144 RepID=A0AAV2RND7_MEGNR